MIQPRILSIVLTILVVGALSPVASAHYRPELGRWLERDPAKYIDGANLYELERSNPCNNSDPTGLQELPELGPHPWETPVVWPPGWNPDFRHMPLPVTDRQQRCCTLAIFQLGTGAIARNVCCDGKIIICVYSPAKRYYPPPDGSKEVEAPAREEAWFIIDKCLLEHERRHAQGQKGSCEGRIDGTSPTPPDNKFGIYIGECEHCLIYQAEIDCLEVGKTRCTGRFAYACKITIDRAIDVARSRWRDLHCDSKVPARARP